MKRRVAASLVPLLLFLRGTGLLASELPPYHIDSWQVDDGFADGAFHVWRDPFIIQAGQQAASGQSTANNTMAHASYGTTDDNYRFGPNWK